MDESRSPEGAAGEPSSSAPAPDSSDSPTEAAPEPDLERRAFVEHVRLVAHALGRMVPPTVLQPYARLEENPVVQFLVVVGKPPLSRGPEWTEFLGRLLPDPELPTWVIAEGLVIGELVRAELKAPASAWGPLLQRVRADAYEDACHPGAAALRPTLSASGWRRWRAALLVVGGLVGLFGGAAWASLVYAPPATSAPGTSLALAMLLLNAVPWYIAWRATWLAPGRWTGRIVREHVVGRILNSLTTGRLARIVTERRSITPDEQTTLVEEAISYAATVSGPWRAMRPVTARTKQLIGGVLALFGVFAFVFGAFGLATVGLVVAIEPGVVLGVDPGRFPLLLAWQLAFPWLAGCVGHALLAASGWWTVKTLGGLGDPMLRLIDRINFMRFVEAERSVAPATSADATVPADATAPADGHGE